MLGDVGHWVGLASFHPMHACFIRPRFIPNAGRYVTCAAAGGDGVGFVSSGIGNGHRGRKTHGLASVATKDSRKSRALASARNETRNEKEPGTNRAPHLLISDQRTRD